MLKMALKPLFQTFRQAWDGLEGLLMFQDEPADLIITDLMMPNMDGISMLRKLRAIDSQVPVLLMTANLEHELLVQAINLGVCRFIPKPLDIGLLRDALESVSRDIASARMADILRRREMELLRYRDRYHSQQEEMARRKERHIAVNMLRDTLLADDTGGWLIDLVHEPKDVMSGDSFSLRLFRDQGALLFLADAMGSGLSASVTSMLSTSFFNHMLEGCACYCINFEATVERVCTYIARNLLEEEVFSCIMAHHDLAGNRLLLAAFGMPPVLALREGKVERIRGGNPPISSYQRTIAIKTLDLTGVTDILLHTDGLSDAEVVGEPYNNFLGRDFSETSTAGQLWERFCALTNSNRDDDSTVIRLIRSGPAVGRRHARFSCPGTLAGITGLEEQCLSYFVTEGVSQDQQDELEVALGEALLNAFEHGCLRLGGARKTELIMSGDYDQVLADAVPRDGEYITLDIYLEQRVAGTFVFLDLQDPGVGWEGAHAAHSIPLSATTTPRGRGLTIIARSVDLVGRSLAGNRVVLAKKLKEENR